MSFATRLLGRFQKSYGWWVTFPHILAYIWAHRCVIDFYNEEKDPCLTHFLQVQNRKGASWIYKVKTSELVDTLLPSAMQCKVTRFFKESFDSVNPHFITILYTQRPPRKSDVVDQRGQLGLPVINVNQPKCIDKAPFSHLSLPASGLVVTNSQKPLLAPSGALIAIPTY